MIAWWRRNALGLVAAPVVVGLAFLVAGDALREHWRDDDPPVRAVEAGEPFTWNGAALTFDSVVAPDPIVDTLGETVDPPTGTRAWRVHFQAEALADDGGLGCRISILDDEQRRFAPAAELSGLAGDTSCSPPYEADPANYELTFWFLLPADASPSAITIDGVVADDSFSVDVS